MTRCSCHFSDDFRKLSRWGAADTLSKVKTTISDETTFTHVSDPRSYDYALANFDRTHYFVANYVWNLPKISQRLDGNWLSRGVFDNWIISGISSIATGNPAELVLSIAGQDAGNRLRGASSNANLSGYHQGHWLISSQLAAQPGF